MPVVEPGGELEALRAIGWTDSDIANQYPHLLPYYFTGEPSTLYERLLTIGWTEERIRTEHPEILPASEGGVEEVVGTPTYTLGEQAGEPIVLDEPIQRDPQLDLDLGPGGGVIIHPVGLPDDWGDGGVPDVAADQTADLLLLGLIFL